MRGSEFHEVVLTPCSGDGVRAGEEGGAERK